MTFTFYLTSATRQRNPANALHLMVAVMLFGIAIASEVLFWFTSVSPNFQSPYLPFAIFGLVCFVVSIALVALTVRQRKAQRLSNKISSWIYLELLLLLIGAGLFLWQGAQLPALLFVVMAIAVAAATFSAARKSNRSEIILNDKSITVPGRVRPYPWREVERLLYRRGTLTIELTGNRIWQQFVTTDADPELFEAWVQAQLKKYAAEKAKEW